MAKKKSFKKSFNDFMPKKSGKSAPGIKVEFWLGLAHGILIIISLIYSLANSKYTIYQMGAGSDYDIGFVIGVVALLVIIF